MADQIVDNLILELRIRMDGLERGLAAAENRIDQFTGNTQSAARQQSAAVKASSQEQSAAYTAIGIAATAAFAVIVSAMKTGINAANQYTSALVGLRSVAEGTGQDFGDIQSALRDLTSDGLIPVSDAATSLKNLLARGFDAQQAVDMLNRLKDSAAFGRQASLTMGDAVRSATEGLKNENSILVDNSGVTKNVSVMWKEYAQQIGKGVNSLTIAEKRQAEYNGIMKETRFQIGDAAKYSAEFAGTQAELQAATLKTQQAFGRATQDGVQPFMKALIPAVGWIEQIIDRNPSLAAGLTATAAAALLTTAGISAVALAGKQLTLVMGALSASMGWIVGIGAAVGILVGFIAASSEAKKSESELNAELRQGVSDARAQADAMQSYLDLVNSGTASHEELAAARQEVAEVSPELVTGYDAEGNALLTTNDIIEDQIGLTKELIERKKELLLLNAQDTIDNSKTRITALQAEADENRRIYQEKKSQYEALKKAGRPEEIYSYEGAEISGATEWDQLVAKLEADMDKLNNRYDEVGDEIVKKNSDIAASLSLQYEEQVAGLGKLSEAQQVIVDQEFALALQRQDSAEVFAENVRIAFDDTGRQAAAERELAAASEETTAAVEKYGTAEKAAKAAQDVNDQRLRAQQLKQYVAELKNAEKGSKSYNAALAKVADLMDTTTGAVEASKDSWDSWATTAEGSAESMKTDVAAGIQTVIDNIDSLGLSAAEATALMQALALAMKAIGIDVTIPEIKSGGGGGTRKKAWETELEMIERVADAEDEYAQQYLDHIDSLLQNDALSSKERQRLEKEREYAVLAVNGELEQAHIEYLERLLQRERLSADERLDIEKQLFQAKSALMDQYQDFADAIMDAYTAKLEAQRDAQLASIQNQISAVQERASKEIDAIRETMDARIDAIDAEIRALDDLAKAQDRADKDEEDNNKLQRLQAQLEYEKDGRNRQKLLEQIAALEKSISDRHAQEQLDDQKQALRDQQEAIRDESDNQIKIIQEQADREQAALNRRYAAAQKYWDNRLQLENVKQEALQFLNDASQQEIIALLESYAPEYLAKGQLLGSQFYGGLKPKIDAIIAEIARMRKEAEKPIVITTIRRTVYETVGGASGTVSRASGTSGISRALAGIQTFAAAPDAATARLIGNVQQAMDGMVYRSIRPTVAAAQTSFSGSSRGSYAQTRTVKVEQKIIMQQPVPSPYQNARALRRESERLAKMI